MNKKQIYQINNYYKKIHNNNYFNKNMIIHKLCLTLKDRYIYEFINKNIKQINEYSEIFGCSEQQFGNHIEKLFKENMTFKNHGKWEIDHIFPVSKCDLNDIESIRKCFHYTNMQPLWKEDNRKKYNKVLVSAVQTTTLDNFVDE